ncbi:MAG TPA: tetratricopeptide repeat protein, partial [Candidatus Xenobia bacterium]
GWDLNVERYVVLKGLINSMDPSAMANAVKEKRFLADLRDPNIVDIVNFVTHEGAQYIVMEFINGVTLKDIRKQHGPLPVQEAVAYTMGVLPAFEFLHSKKIVYCDFKIENAMVQKDRLRLIDLGGARRIDDIDSDMFLTVGYSAPEAEKEVSYSSDLYTVGRTLAVLLMDFDFRGQHRHSLPTPQDVPIFAEFESLYRFLLRSTAQDPDDRFQSAPEMQAQLEGVLREIVAIQSGSPRPAESTCFGLDVVAANGVVNHHSLPVLRIDRQDPARAVVESALVLNDPHRQKQLLERAQRQYPHSTEAPLRLANCCIDLEQFGDAQLLLDTLAKDDPFDWRVVWFRGRSLLAQKKHKDCYPFFDAVYSELPGELAPKLAVGIVAELTGNWEQASRLYDMVSRVDPGYTTASFGLARCLAVQNDRTAAVEAFARVPPMSIAFVPAQLQQVRTLIQSHPHPPSRDDLAKAAQTLENIKIAGFERSRLEADLLLEAARLLEAGKIQGDERIKLLGQPLNDVPRLRAKAEAALRQCAKFVDDRSLLLMLVDEANAVRPRTLF